MTVRGQGQSQCPITPPHPKPPEKKTVIYFAVTSTKRDHVAYSGGTLIMLSEEDRRMLSPSAVTARHAGIEPMWARLSLAAQILCQLFFSHRSLGGRKMGGREGRSRSLKRKLSVSAERQDWNTCSASTQPSAWDFPKRDTHSAWGSGLWRWREEIWDAGGEAGAYIARCPAHFGGLWQVA